MKIMYQIGEFIIYGSYGVCKVEAVGTPDIAGVDKERLYYTLAPSCEYGKIFTPVDSKVFMRPVITRAEAQKLISLIPSVREASCDNRKLRSQEECFKELIKSHDCVDLIRILKTIYAKMSLRTGIGTGLGRMDERYMKKAEGLLYGELAVALGLPVDNVKGYIEDQVKGAEK